MTLQGLKGPVLLIALWIVGISGREVIPQVQAQADEGAGEQRRAAAVQSGNQKRTWPSRLECDDFLDWVLDQAVCLCQAPPPQGLARGLDRLQMCVSSLLLRRAARVKPVEVKRLCQMDGISQLGQTQAKVMVACMAVGPVVSTHGLIGRLADKAQVKGGELNEILIALPTS